MRVALVHDALVDTGGAERVVQIFHEIFPDAPLYTSVYNPATTFAYFKEMDIRTSFLQRVASSKKTFRLFFPLYPLAFEQFNLAGYDIVLSSSTYWAKGVITRPETCHICYCNTPSRVAWRYHDYVAQENFGWLMRALLPLLVKSFRDWDVLTAQRVDYFIAGSHNAAKRIRKYYRRQATVIHSPIDASSYKTSSAVDDYFLIVSRLNSYKRIDLAIEAFNELGLPLIIVGDGPQRRRLEAMARSNIRFTGRVADENLRDLYAACKALVVPGEEDYGLTSLEAQASRRPVIAYGRGGALETIVPSVTGMFFDKQTPQALAEVVRKFDTRQFDPVRIRAHAIQFDREAFKQQISRFVAEKYDEHSCLMDEFHSA